MVLKGSNVLVTGGKGFIGSHLVKALIENKCKVVVFDLPANDPLQYFNEQGLSGKVILETGDINDFVRINSVIIKQKIDFVFHLAAQAVIETTYQNPLYTISTNAAGTANLLESCRQYGQVRGILVTSTDKVYGKLSRVSESTPISGDHPYEVSKTSADLISRSYYKTYNLPVVVTRFGNVYGEGDLNFSRIIPGIMSSILKSETLQIRSNGKFVRDYVYVKDIVKATLLLAKNINKVKGEAFNVSSLENYSVLDVIKKVEGILNVKVDYKILSTAINEIPVQSVNFGKIKKDLGWKPKNTFESTMPGILAWYQSYFNLL